MTSDPSRPRPRARRLGLVLAVLFCLPLGGCGLVLDEFTWLDRMPPKPDAAAAPAPALRFVGR